MSDLHIALIGFGEVGVTLADTLNNAATIAAWDLKFSEASSAPSRAAATRSIRVARGPEDAVRAAGLVISCVTAAQTISVANDCAKAIGGDAFFLDLNSASPRAKKTAALVINGAGGRYVEAAVMTPIQPRQLAAPLLLGGPHANAFLTMARRVGFTSVQPVSEDYGVAAATKLCRSIIVKGLEALLTESMLSARHYGVSSAVLTSLNDFFPGVAWPALVRYMISRSIEHGARRAEELREAAHMVADTPLEPLMSEAIANRQFWSSGLKLPEEQDLPAFLDAILEQLDANPAQSAAEKATRS